MWQRPSFQAASAEAAEKQLVADLTNGDTRQRHLGAINQAYEDERLRRELAIDSTTPIYEDRSDDEHRPNCRGCDFRDHIAGCDLRILKVLLARKLKRPSTCWQIWTRLETSAKLKWCVGPVSA